MQAIRINLNPIPIFSLKLLLTNFPNMAVMGKCECVTVERLLYLGCLEQDISTTKVTNCTCCVLFRFDFCIKGRLSTIWNQEKAITYMKL